MGMLTTHPCSGITGYFAHSENGAGVKHELVQHLKEVAQLAGEFAAKFGARDFGYCAGLWHDLGKFHPDFQSYIENPRGRRGPDHSSAGAVQAMACFEPLAFPVAGHHAGLPNWADLKGRLREKSSSLQVVEALRVARTHLSSLAPAEPLLQKLPRFLAATPSRHSASERLERETELFLRMVFSALVDADFLDTEAHFDPQLSMQRDGAPALEELWNRFEKDQARVTGRHRDQLNQLRHEIYGASVNAADEVQGIFSLTVPTGGGKTRSGMAFALRHALRHGLDRVIVAIPYTSIIEQSADVYRQVFLNGVLEHHSAVASREDVTDPISLGDVWARLASQNWDAPIVVTTTVQLFESLFGNRPSSCRKLHNIARSVLILDEVQTLPTHLLEPILDVLQQLVDHYGVTVVLCTATQPTFTAGPYLRGLGGVREIVPDPPRYFAALKRVRYEYLSAGERWTWERVAEEMRTADQALAVVNTKRDAFALLDALDDPAALHLSTQMCGAHRLETLHEVRRRLEAGRPCRLISTQVVEAGVDLDFPLVLRALGPLDRIVQAAGRCNREGRLEAGRVVIFDAVGSSSPPGVYRSGIDIAAGLLASGCDLHDPRTYEVYFERLFQATELDGKGIQKSRRSLNFAEVAEKFRMIEDDSAPAVVRPEGHGEKVGNLLAVVRRREAAPRSVFRRLQPYLVSVRSRLIPTFERNGLLQKVAPGLWEWLGGYDRVRGLVESAREPGDLVI